MSDGGAIVAPVAQNSAGSRPASRQSSATEGPDWTPVRPQRRKRVVAAVVALAMLLTAVGGTAAVVLSATSASAHDQLLSADPEDGAALDEPVEEITLTFSADVIADGTQVRVTPPDGEPVDAEISVDGTDVIADLGEQAAGGDYAVEWRVVSSDGHPITGELGYTVADQPAAAEMTDEPVPAASAEAELEESGDLEGLGAAPEPSESTPAEESSDEAGTMPVLYGAALVLMIGVAVALLMRSRRRLHESQQSDPTDSDQA